MKTSFRINMFKRIELTMIILYLLIFIFVSININAQGTTSDIKNIQKFIEINDAKLFINIEGKVSPTIIFISGSGEDHTTWKNVQSIIAENNLTFSYDRSGIGKSESSTSTKDADGMSQELNSILTQLKLDTKYILVGHSLGCQIAKVYAHKYPTQIGGILFIDPGFNEDSLKTVLTEDEWDNREKMILKYTPSMNLAQKEEKSFVNKSCVEADSSFPFTEIPIILLTATKYNPDFPGAEKELEVKKRYHENWIKQMPDAKHKFINSSRHYIQNEDPDIVIEAIRELISR
jgi:pimeloyl-ACP methyl ester carboxylesterase